MKDTSKHPFRFCVMVDGIAADQVIKSLPAVCKIPVPMECTLIDFTGSQEPDLYGLTQYETYSEHAHSSGEILGEKAQIAFYSMNEDSERADYICEQYADLERGRYIPKIFKLMGLDL